MLLDEDDDVWRVQVAESEAAELRVEVGHETGERVTMVRRQAGNHENPAMSQGTID